MGASNEGLSQQAIDASPPFQSNFDPSELLGSRTPFVNPFSSDDSRFQASSSIADLSMLTCLTLANNPFQEFYQEPHRIVQLATALSDTPPKESNTRRVRVRLRSHQAIQIFIQRKEKTRPTAAMLATKYGISSKAIRDIWTRKSWSEDTRPYWTHLDK